MAWWVRLIVTLVLAPLVWRVVGAYVESQQGGALPDVLAQSVPVLGKLYLAATLPAAAVLLAVVLPLDLLLRRLGLALLVVGVAPLVACAVPFGLARVLPGARGDAMSGLVGLGFAYGLTWALTIREPAASKGVEIHDAGAPAQDDALADGPG